MSLGERARPYVEAFGRNRQGRLSQLKRIRAQLNEAPALVSTFNWGYRELVANWVASCDRNGVDCRSLSLSLLFPTDERSESFAGEIGLRVYFDGQS
jgi:hypothetical protein